MYNFNISMQSGGYWHLESNIDDGWTMTNGSVFIVVNIRCMKVICLHSHMVKVKSNLLYCFKNKNC